MPIPFMTIAIPTYNRVSAILNRVQEIVDLELHSDFQVLVIDNHSNDGTFEQLADRFQHQNIRILQNSENLGYAGNALRLIEEVQTQYLLLLSDEDQVDAEGLRKLADFCQLEQPDFVSPQASVGATMVYRGRTSTRLIRPEEFEEAAFYVSGLTFDSAIIKKYAESIKAHIPSNSAATVYPQVLLAALIIARGNSYFLPVVVTRQLEQLVSHIIDPNAGSYYTVPGRWAQFQGFEKFFERELFVKSDADSVARIMLMRDHTRNQLLHLLLSAAIAENPELDNYIWRMSLKYGLAGFWQGATMRLRRIVGSLRQR